ncbi:MAG: prepilin-type N-terminal cleavage/methylation domain-containing protein [Verrucomicrobiae bacterium]|nr:prepilin-type N-terminal cleavage/methylation domain-containing protein [Verrucomicrobiae bacterium]
MRRPTGHQARSAPPAGFTLIEVMLAVSITTLIIFGLYAVFDQTQKALRQTVAQVDVLESIRIANDVLTRELETVSPAEPGNVNSNLIIHINPVSASVDVMGLGGTDNPVLRTSLQDIFFLTRQNDQWTAIGYWVGPVSSNQVGQPISVGRLYRFEHRVHQANLGGTNLLARFQNPVHRLADSQMVLDGLVHLRVLAYDSHGQPLVQNWVTNPPAINLRPWSVDPVRSTETAYGFNGYTRPSLPSHLEIEIGILEPQAVARFASIPVATEARRYLARNAGQIHLFRQRIPLRNAPPY